MLRSLFSAISGLRANQTMIDVTGNNVANANTVGFKSSNVLFQDTLSQMLTAGTEATTTRGGTNPVQIGLGVSVAGTTTNFGQGSAQVTGRQTDLMIQGDGFFVVQRNGEDVYTRAGAFNWDAAGNLVTPDGDFVMGYRDTTPANDSAEGFATTGAAAPALVKINIKDPALGTDPLVSLKIGSDGVITGVYDTDPTTRPLFQIATANFTNPGGLEKIGDTMFRASNASGTADLGAPGVNGMGMVLGGSLEMSNVDLAQEFTNLIIAQRGFQATSRVITTSDQVLEELVNIKR